MQTLNNMIRPDLGLFTNIGDAHGVNFSSIEEKINEKLKLFEGAKKLICPQDNQLLYDMVSVFCKKNDIKLISYHTEDMAQKLQLPFKDRVSKENAVAAFVLCSQIGIDENKLKQRIDMLTPLDMRMQIQSTGSSILLNDCYSLDITSLEAALDYLNTQEQQVHMV